MYKIYLKQALQMLKQNKFISIVSIAGMALAIMMIMVVIETEEIKTANLHPEVNRDRTYYLEFEQKKSKDEQQMNINSISFDTYKAHLSDLKTPELTVIMYRESWGDIPIQSERSQRRFFPTLIHSDADFWKLMRFSFVEGRAYNNEEVEAGIKNTVISQGLATQLFGKESALGETILIADAPYKVIGVVQDVSGVFQFSHADVWIPYSSKENYEQLAYSVLFLLKNRSDRAALEQEIREVERKFDVTDEIWNLSLFGPYDTKQQTLFKDFDKAPDVFSDRMRMVVIFLILLIIPAVNLSGLSMSRIRKRVEEIGIRKAFGAKNSTILIQVLFENLITSLIGGIVGLLASYGIIVWLKKWLLDLSSGADVPMEALISLPVLLYVFLACLLLNLLSAGIPAYKASKLRIVDSINKNSR